MFIIISKYIISHRFTGIALFPFIIIRDKKDKKNRRLINHEKIHLRQQIELLILPFYILYAIEFLIHYIRYKNKNIAYRNISFEREAYLNEKDLGYLKRRKYYSFIKYIWK